MDTHLQEAAGLSSQSTDTHLRADIEQMLAEQADRLMHEFEQEIQQREQDWSEKENYYVDRVSILQTQVDQLAQQFSRITGMGGHDTEMLDASSANPAITTYPNTMEVPTQETSNTGFLDTNLLNANHGITTYPNVMEVPPVEEASETGVPATDLLNVTTYPNVMEVPFAEESSNTGFSNTYLQNAFTTNPAFGTTTYPNAMDVPSDSVNHIPSLGQASSSQSRHLRPRDPQTGLAKPSINGKPSPAATKSTKRKGKARKRPSEIHCLLASETPADASGLKDALNLHLRLLWGLVDASNVPSNPSTEQLALFDSRVSTNDELRALRDPGSSLISPSIVQVCKGIDMADNRKAARQMLLVEEAMLGFMQSRLAKYGLLRWCPDFRRTPYSLYNSACRMVALDTFRQALVSHAYAHLQPNISYASDTGLLIKLYDHRVHHFYLARYRKNIRNPGSVEAQDAASSYYQARRRLANARYNFAESIGLQHRYLDIINAKATSDDEADSLRARSNGRVVHIIRKRPERSAQAESFIRLLDKRREEDGKYDPNSRINIRRERVVPDTNQPTTLFPALPPGMLIDYFDPTFFNALPSTVRQKVTNFQVAFIPGQDPSLGEHPDEKLDDTKFQHKYLESVLARYQIEDLFGETFPGDPDTHGSTQVAPAPAPDPVLAHNINGGNKEADVFQPDIEVDEGEVERESMVFEQLSTASSSP